MTDEQIEAWLDEKAAQRIKIRQRLDERAQARPRRGLRVVGEDAGGIGDRARSRE